MPEIKVLYLHVFEDEKSLKIKNAIEETYGKENVTYPRLKHKKIAILFFLILCLIYIASIYIAFWYLSKFKNFVYILIPLWLLITAVILFPGVIFIYEVIYRKALAEARALYQTFSPNVIVTYHLGWALVTCIEEAKVPMLLISPVQENLVSSYLRKSIQINKYPYIIFVHTNSDNKYNLKTTLKLVESGDKNKCRVEIVEGGNNLDMLTGSDYKSWIDEIYYEGLDYKKKEEPPAEEQFDSEEKPLLSGEV